MAIIAMTGHARAGEFVVQEYTVYDGDTLTHATVNVFPNINYTGSIRIRGIDTPEIRTKSPCEKALGKKAAKFLSKQLRGKKITVANVSNGKYAGRVIGDVYADGMNIGGAMLRHGYAKQYHGGARDRGWCHD